MIQKSDDGGGRDGAFVGGFASDKLLRFSERFVLEFTGAVEVGSGFGGAAGGSEDAAESDVGSADLVAAARLVLAGELNGLEKKRLGLLQITLGISVQAKEEPRFGPGRIDFLCSVQMKIGFLVTTVVRIEITEEIVGQEISGKVVEFGDEFLPNLRGISPFIFPEQREAEEIMGVRGAGIQGDGAAEFADGVVHHFRVAVGASEKNVQGTEVADGLHDAAENFGGLLFAFGILEGKEAGAESIRGFKIRM